MKEKLIEQIENTVYQLSTIVDVSYSAKKGYIEKMRILLNLFKIAFESEEFKLVTK